MIVWSTYIKGWISIAFCMFTAGYPSKNSSTNCLALGEIPGPGLSSRVCCWCNAWKVGSPQVGPVGSVKLNQMTWWHSHDGSVHCAAIYLVCHGSHLYVRIFLPGPWICHGIEHGLSERTIWKSEKKQHQYINGLWRSMKIYGDLWRSMKIFEDLSKMSMTSMTYLWNSEASPPIWPMVQLVEKHCQGSPDGGRPVPYLAVGFPGMM